MWKLVYGTAVFLFAMFSLFLLLSSPFSFDKIVSGFGSSLSYTALHTNLSIQPRLLLDRYCAYLVILMVSLNSTLFLSKM